MKNGDSDKERMKAIKIQEALENFPPKMRHSLLAQNVFSANSDMNSFFQYLAKNNIVIPHEKQQDFENVIKQVQKETNKDILEIANEVVQEHDALCKELSTDFNSKKYQYDDVQESEIKEFQKDWERAVNIVEANKKHHKKLLGLYKENMQKNIGVVDGIRNAVQDVTGIDLKNLKSIGGVLMKKMKSMTGGGNIKKSESETLSAIYSPKSVISGVAQLSALALVSNVVPLISITGAVSSMMFLFPLFAVGIVIHRVSPLQIPIIGGPGYVDPEKAESTSFNFIQKDGILLKGTRESVKNATGFAAEDKKKYTDKHVDANKEKDYFTAKGDILNTGKKHQAQKGPSNSR